MLSLAQVSSMKTSRSTGRFACRSRQSVRCSATSGRSCWAARSVFFEAQPLPIAEPPDRSVANHQALLRQLPAQLFQAQVRRRRDPCQKPLAIRTDNPRPALPAHGLRRHTAGPTMWVNPADHTAYTDAEHRRGLMPAQARLNRRHHPQAKIVRVRFHPCWPPPSQQLESQIPPSGNPYDSIRPDYALAGQGRVIQVPVVLVSVNLRHARERGRKLRFRIAPKMGDDAAFAAAEILLEPVVDLGSDEFIGLELGAARMIDIGPRRFVEHAGDGRTGERPVLQVRAADGRAIHGVVDPPVIPDRPQNAMLDVVERERIALDRDQFLVPRP